MPTRLCNFRNFLYKEPEMERGLTGRRVAILSLGIIMLAALTMFLAGQSERYSPPYSLSLKLEPDPIRGVQTPYRSLISFRTSGSRDKVARQIMQDLERQGIRWNLKKPSGQDVSYHIDNPSEPDRSKAEGLNIYADPDDPRITIVTFCSPWRSPSKLQLWWYGTAKWIRREDSLL